MPTKDSFSPDHPLPHFLSEEQPGIGKAWDRAAISSRIFKTSILGVTAAAIGIAILLVGNPVALFTTVTASLVDISAPQPGTGQSTPTIQSTAGTQDSPAARDAPTREEITAALKTAQGQAEIPQPSAEAPLKQFQAWASEEDSRAPVEAVQPVQDARAQVGSVQLVQDDQAQVVQNAPAEVRPMQKHRHVRRVQNARAEIRPVQNPRAKVRREQHARAQVAPVRDPRAQDQREQNARAQVAPVQDPRAQDQSVQNAQAPSFLQNFGWRN
jgi:hypothetical protein